MEVGKLSAEVRVSKGKEAAHKLRASGKIPRPIASLSTC